MKDCIFCKIVGGELEANKVFENELAVSFISKEQVSKGHTLIIPKDHYENIFDIPEELLSEVIKMTKNVSQRCEGELGATGVNILNASGKDAQQSVSHFHVHVVPRYQDDGLDLWIRSGL